MSFIVSIVKSSGTTQEQAFRFPVVVTAGWNSTDIEWVENKCRTTFGVVHGTICELLTSGVKVPIAEFINNSRYTFENFSETTGKPVQSVVNSHLLTSVLSVF
jgi:hypothetical protein